MAMKVQGGRMVPAPGTATTRRVATSQEWAKAVDQLTNAVQDIDKASSVFLKDEVVREQYNILEQALVTIAKMRQQAQTMVNARKATERMDRERMAR